MRNLVKELKSTHAAPIDGVGLQGHFKIDQLTEQFVAKVGQTIDDLGVAGFTVNITELDIRICTGDNGNIQTQKDAYKRIVSTAFNLSLIHI